MTNNGLCCTCSRHVLSILQVSGSKFYYLKNEAVLLEMGLVNWAVSEVMKKGFTPLTTPEIVRSSVVEKCGFQPRGTNTQVISLVMSTPAVDMAMHGECAGKSYF